MSGEMQGIYRARGEGSQSVVGRSEDRVIVGGSELQ